MSLTRTAVIAVAVAIISGHVAAAPVGAATPALSSVKRGISISGPVPYKATITKPILDGGSPQAQAALGRFVSRSIKAYRTPLLKETAETIRRVEAQGQRCPYERWASFDADWQGSLAANRYVNVVMTFGGRPGCSYGVAWENVYGFTADAETGRRVRLTHFVRRGADGASTFETIFDAAYDALAATCYKLEADDIEPDLVDRYRITSEGLVFTLRRYEGGIMGGCGMPSFTVPWTSFALTDAGSALVEALTGQSPTTRSPNASMKNVFYAYAMAMKRGDTATALSLVKGATPELDAIIRRSTQQGSGNPAWSPATTANCTGAVCSTEYGADPGPAWLMRRFDGQWKVTGNIMKSWAGPGMQEGTSDLYYRGLRAQGGPPQGVSYWGYRTKTSIGTTLAVQVRTQRSGHNMRFDAYARVDSEDGPFVQHQCARGRLGDWGRSDLEAQQVQWTNAYVPSPDGQSGINGFIFTSRGKLNMHALLDLNLEQAGQWYPVLQWIELTRVSRVDVNADRWGKYVSLCNRAAKSS